MLLNGIGDLDDGEAELYDRGDHSCHELRAADVLIGQGQTVIPRPLRRRLCGFRSKTSCRLNDIRDAPRSD
jgi:hypothetical protein